MKQEYSAGIVLYKEQNGERQYLLLQYAAGHWDFPKGHVEKGETKEEAALRELFEETGLTTTIDPSFVEQFSYIFTAPDTIVRRKTVYFFIGKATETDVKLSHEHKGYAWLSYPEAQKQLTYENAQQLLATIDAYLHES